MALNPVTLAGLIQAQMIANPACGAVPGPALDALCLAIATAVVTHLTTSGVVTGTATGAMGGGPGVPIVGVVT